MKFEEEGIFIGMVDYPFSIDEKAVFDIFADFLRNRFRGGYLERLSGESIEEDIYSPRAYRVFGDGRKLAIISLTDEYGLGRLFLYPMQIEINKGGTKYGDSRTVLAGLSDRFWDEDVPYLRNRAQNTFLRESKRFPFIAIIQIKIGGFYLRESGNSTIRKIKRLIDSKFQLVSSRCSLDSIVVDTYDNDDLLVVAFSDSINSLRHYYEKIQGITSKDVGMSPEDVGTMDRPVLSSCSVNYGYDIFFSFKRSNDGFIPWDIEKDNEFHIDGLFEAKPGHRLHLAQLLRSIGDEKGGGTIDDIRYTITSNIFMLSLPIARMDSLYSLMASKEFDTHLHRSKLSLNTTRLDIEPKRLSFAHPKEKVFIDNQLIYAIDDALRNIGVSKIIQQRVLSFIRVFNDYACKYPQLYVIESLEPSIRNLLFILKSFQDSETESIYEIEKRLHEEVSALERAFNNWMSLDFGGDLLLRAFGFASKEIIRIVIPELAKSYYSIVSGIISKEYTTATHTELNINIIRYPQLFCFASWREASKYLSILFDSTATNERKGAIQKYYGFFNDVIQNQSAMDTLWDILLNKTQMARSDTVYHTLRSLLVPKMLKNTLQDYIVYHFAFQRDFELMWYYYWKEFLQTPSVYWRRGKVNRKAFVFLLVRLLLIAYRETESERRTKILSFIADQQSVPFDYLLSNVWFECFDKVNRSAKQMCESLRSFSYVHTSEYIVLYFERKLMDPDVSNWSFTPYLLQNLSGHKDVLDSLETVLSLLNSNIMARKRLIEKMMFQISDERFDSEGIDSYYESPDNTICLMNAFLRVVKELDLNNKEGGVLLHSVPRLEEKGEIDFETICQLSSSFSANLLADPRGGFIVPSPWVRKRYAAYRNLFFKTLLDWSYRTKAPLYHIIWKP